MPVQNAFSMPYLDRKILQIIADPRARELGGVTLDCIINSGFEESERDEVHAALVSLVRRDVIRMRWWLTGLRSKKHTLYNITRRPLRMPPPVDPVALRPDFSLRR